MANSKSRKRKLEDDESENNRYDDAIVKANLEEYHRQMIDNDERLYWFIHTAPESLLEIFKRSDVDRVNDLWEMIFEPKLEPNAPQGMLFDNNQRKRLFADCRFARATCDTLERIFFDKRHPASMKFRNLMMFLNTFTPEKLECIEIEIDNTRLTQPGEIIELQRFLRLCVNVRKFKYTTKCFEIYYTTFMPPLFFENWTRCQKFCTDQIGHPESAPNHSTGSYTLNFLFILVNFL